MTEAQRGIVSTIREFVRREVNPVAQQMEHDDEYPVELVERMKEMGLFGAIIPEEYGGLALDVSTYALIIEEICRGWMSLSGILNSHLIMAYMVSVNGTQEQKENYLPLMATGEKRGGICITEPNAGSDVQAIETRAVRDGDDWVINGVKRFNTGLHNATLDMIFARTSGRPGEATGITAFLVPTDAPGFSVDYMHWTFNMPSDHAEVTLTDVRVPDSTILHREGEGLMVAQHFLHENRIRQAASSVGVARYCIEQSVAYAKTRKTWGKPLAVNQAIQFPLAELHTEAAMVRNLVYRTAWHLDRQDHMAVSDQVSMCNYRANRLACQAADQAMQVHGGIGYTRSKPFEHIYRHHRRYRITEGSEEIQIRKVAGHLFGFTGVNKGR